MGIPPRTARSGDRVRVHYLQRREDGRVLDDSSNSGPIEFEIGSNEFFHDLESAVVGLCEGECTTIHLSAERAYGSYRHDLVYQVDKDEFGDDKPIASGMRLRAPTRGASVDLTVTSVDGPRVTLDANHPLAGQALHFDLKLIEILPADAGFYEGGSNANAECGLS